MSKRLKHTSDFRLGFVNGPSFGEVVRGARLGWRWSPRHLAFIRMSHTGSGAAVAVQLRPMGTLDSRSSGDYYIVWWEDPGLLDCIAELRMIRRVKRPIYFEVPLSREIPDPPVSVGEAR